LLIFAVLVVEEGLKLCASLQSLEGGVVPDLLAGFDSVSGSALLDEFVAFLVADAWGGKVREGEVIVHDIVMT
jgi:hypothetical protein